MKYELDKRAEWIVPSLPLVGKWIEICNAKKKLSGGLGVFPWWGSGLKYCGKPRTNCMVQSLPLVGKWIEMTVILSGHASGQSLPLVGKCIEINYNSMGKLYPLESSPGGEVD